MNKITLLFLLLSFISCRKKDTDPKDFPINTLNEEYKILKERQQKGILQPINSFVFYGEPLGFVVEDEILNIFELFSKDLYKVSLKGQILAKYTFGKGEGPKELLNPISFFLKGDTIDVVDAGSLAVKRILIKNDGLELLNQFKIKNTIYKLHQLEENEFVLTTNSNDGIVFQIIDVSNKNKRLTFINELFHPVDAAGMHYDGIIKSMGDRIFYFPYANSKFISFTKNELLYIGEIVHKVPRRNIQVTGSMTRLVSYESAVLDFDVDENYIYLLSGVIHKSRGEELFSLDLYDTSTGEYRHSYHLPSHPESILYVPQKIKVFHEKIIIQYQEGAFTVFENPINF